MTTTTTPHHTGSPDTVRTDRRWLWWGAAAGGLGIFATILTTTITPKGAGPDVVNSLPIGLDHLGGALGYLVVACLLVFASNWRHAIAGVDSAAARIVPDALVATAAGLTLGYGWKLALALYAGGINNDEFGTQGKFVYYVLNDFGSYLGWLGVVVAAGAVAYLGFRRHLVAPWLAVISVLPVLAVLVLGAGVGIAGYAGIVGPVWLFVTSCSLALGQHRIFQTTT